MSIIIIIIVVVVVVVVVGRTCQTETAMWGDMFYSATITLVPPVTLVLRRFTSIASST